MVEKSGTILAQAAVNLVKNGSQLQKSYTCNVQGQSNKTRIDYETAIDSYMKSSSKYLMIKDRTQTPLIVPDITLNIELQSPTSTVTIGERNIIFLEHSRNLQSHLFNRLLGLRKPIQS